MRDHPAFPSLGWVGVLRLIRIMHVLLLPMLLLMVWLLRRLLHLRLQLPLHILRFSRDVSNPMIKAMGA